jgi:hypothetical protein
MKDIVIGTATNLKYDYIEMWCNSLDQSGFDGIKALLVTNLDDDIVERLINRGYTIFTIDTNAANGSIYVNRFYYYWDILSKSYNENDIRYVISTDVTDVIFQKNPSKWLEENLNDYKIVASSEEIYFKNEPWNRNNMLKSFGRNVYEHHKDNVVYNAGVIAGHYNYIKDLFLNVFLMCGSAPSIVDGGGGPDQSAYNILINSSTYKDIVLFETNSWAAQLGVSGPTQRKKYGNDVLGVEPTFINDIIYNYLGEPYTLVHQYNRVPLWNSVVNKYAKGA